MTNIEKVKNAVAKPQKALSIEELIKKSTSELGKALPEHMKPERIVRIALTSLRTNPKLYQCDPYSFLGALFQSAQLGLEPNIEGQAYLIPYGKNVQFQVGYKGFVELFYRHSKAVSLHFDTVHENDFFDYSYGTDMSLKHTPAHGDKGEVVAYYAVAKMKDGASAFKVMTQDECVKHGKKHSKTYSSGPWKTDLDAMCKKTVLIQLMKLLPKSIEIQRAVKMDETVKSKVALDMFEVPDETKWEEEKVTEVTEVTEVTAEPKKEKVEDTPTSDELFGGK